MNKIMFFVSLAFAVWLSSSLVFGMTLNLDYSTYLGGSGNDQGNGISLGTDRAVYVTGYTRSSNFPTENPYQAGFGGSEDAFVSSFSSSGSTLLYSTYLGGSDHDRGNGISVGTDGEAYITGYTKSSDFPTENPYQASHGGVTYDVFVSALSSSGATLLYSTYLGGSTNDQGNGITLGTDGRVYVTGKTESPDFPTENPYQGGHGGGINDVFVSTLSSTGSALFNSTYLGGSGSDYGLGISVGTDGVTYVIGYTDSSDFPMKNPYQAGHAGGAYDVFVSALSFPGSTLLYSTYLGGSGMDFGRGISLGSDGAAYITGDTRSSDFPTKNPYQTRHGGGTDDVFVSRLNLITTPTPTLTPSVTPTPSITPTPSPTSTTTPIGYKTPTPTSTPIPTPSVTPTVTPTPIAAPARTNELQLEYSTYLGGTNADEARSITVATDGRAYVTGKTWSSDFPVESPYQSAFGGGDYDAFVTALSSTGSTLSYSTYLGGSGWDYGRGISLGTDDSAYVTGETWSSDFPTENPYQSTSGGISDAFVSKLTSSLSEKNYHTDFNGDGISDIAIYRESSGLWAIRGVTRLYFGGLSAEAVPGDYDGDGTTDISIFREASGLWALRGVSRIYFGSSSDLPRPGDYDGDGTTDIGIFRDTSGLWAIRGVTWVYFGGSTDEPAPGYYDGDGSKDIGIFRSSSGLWAIRFVTRIYFGGSRDTVIPGDYDGDGTWEAGIFRLISGLWAIRGVTRSYFGSAIDEPVPADYDGSGMDNIGIFRTSSGLWAIRDITRAYFGKAGDIPVTR